MRYRLGGAALLAASAILVVSPAASAGGPHSVGGVRRGGGGGGGGPGIGSAFRGGGGSSSFAPRSAPAFQGGMSSGRGGGFIGGMGQGTQFNGSQFNGYSGGRVAGGQFAGAQWNGGGMPSTYRAANRGGYVPTSNGFVAQNGLSSNGVAGTRRYVGGGAPTGVLNAPTVRNTGGTPYAGYRTQGAGGNWIGATNTNGFTPGGQAALDRLNTRGAAAGAVGVRRGNIGSPLGDTGGAAVAGMRRSGPTAIGGTTAATGAAVAGTRRGAVTYGSGSTAVTLSPRAGVRYGPGGGTASSPGHYGAVSYYGPYGGHYHTGPYGGYYGHVGCAPWGGHYCAWGHPCYHSCYGAGWGFGIGFPLFGFGLSYYDSYYDPYFSSYAPGPVYGGPVYGAPSYGAPYGDPGYGVPYDGTTQGPPVVGPQAPPASPENAVPAPDASKPVVPPPPAQDTEATRKAFEEATRLFLDAKYDQAMVKFKAMVQADPQNGEAWLAVTHSAFATGQWGEAARAIEKAAAIGAFPRGYRFDPKPLYPKEGAFEAFHQRLKDHAREQRQDADAHLVLAYLSIALGETSTAQVEMAWVKSMRPNDPTVAALETALLPPEPPPSQPSQPSQPGQPTQPGQDAPK